jgi:colanic acid biosynthesis glycosyl transferase WcaI
VLPVWVSSLFKKKFDLVFSVAPPFHLGFLPLLYSKMKGAVCVSHIQDLQVDAAAELGMIKNKGFLKAMFASEKFILDKSTYVSTISSGMLRRIKQKGINENKLILIPNWVDTSKIYPLSTEESLRSEFGIPFGDKVVLYSGNLGEKQGLTSILELANYFRNRANVHFLIVGAGGAKASLEQAAAEQNLHNLRFFPLQPFDRLSALLATADLHLVLQKGSASDLVMPSKLTGILAAGGCPVVTASPGTSLYDVVNSYKLGILVEPDSITALIKGVEKGLTEDIEKFKLNARIYAQEYLDRHSILTEFETKILKAI